MGTFDSIVKLIGALISILASIIAYDTLQFNILDRAEKALDPSVKQHWYDLYHKIHIRNNSYSSIIVGVLCLLLVAILIAFTWWLMSLSLVFFVISIIAFILLNGYAFTIHRKQLQEIEIKKSQKISVDDDLEMIAKRKVNIDIIIFVLLIILIIVSLIELPSITSPADTTSGAVSSNTASSSIASSSDVSSSTVSSYTPSTEPGNMQVTKVTNMIFDGFKYTGEVINYGGQLRPHGQGTAYYDDGSVYEGGWEYGKRHGEAKFWSSKGWFFHGEFLANEKDTKGTHENYPDGHGAKGTYVGTVIDGKFEGEATFEYETGEKFEGEFSANEQWDGTFYNGDGSVLYRVKDGKRVS